MSNDPKHPKAILGVSNTQLSIARHYGGIKFNGKGYTYLPEHDTLIRDDLVKAYGKLKKEGKEHEAILKQL